MARAATAIPRNECGSSEIRRARAARAVLGQPVAAARYPVCSMPSYTSTGSLKLPGITTTVDMRTGERSVLNFLLRPMLKSKEAFRER
jgi:hypothetical protein